MAASDEDYRKAMNAEIQAKLAAQAEGPTASPSVPYVKYMAEESDVPDKIHPDIRRAVYTKRIPLSNIPPEDIRRYRLGAYLADSYLKNSRPTFAGGNDEEITCSLLPRDLELRLTAGKDGFLIKQIGTSTSIRRVETSGAGATPKKSRWGFLSRGGEK